MKQYRVISFRTIKVFNSLEDAIEYKRKYRGNRAKDNITILPQPKILNPYRSKCK